MRLSRWLFVIWTALAAPVFAQEVEIIGKGSPVRGALLDAARPVFAAETGGPVEFVVTTLKVYGDWAYGDVRLQRPGGAPIDWSNTKFAEDLAQGMFETEHNLFLLKNGGTGWRVIEYVLGPTDIAWVSWQQDYKLPEDLFAPD